MRLTQPCLFVVVSLSNTAFQDIVRLLNHQSRDLEAIMTIPVDNIRLEEPSSKNWSTNDGRWIIPTKEEMNICAVLLAFCKHPRANLTPNGSFIWEIYQQESENSWKFHPLSSLATWIFIKIAYWFNHVTKFCYVITLCSYTVAKRKQSRPDQRGSTLRDFLLLRMLRLP